MNANEALDNGAGGEKERRLQPSWITALCGMEIVIVRMWSLKSMKVCPNHNKNELRYEVARLSPTSPNSHGAFIGKSNGL